jgi:hypothetical protein
MSDHEHLSRSMDLLERLKGDALLAILQPKEAGGRDPELPGEHGAGDLPPPFSQERCQLIVQRLPHEQNVNKRPFLLRNFILANDAANALKPSSQERQSFVRIPGQIGQ